MTTPADDVRALFSLAYRQMGPRLVGFSVDDALRRVVSVPYGFRSQDAQHVTWDEAEARGYAACGEAAAYLAAVALQHGHHAAIRVVTDDACGDQYRHAVAVVDGVVLDPYRAHACGFSPRTLAVCSPEGCR